MNTECSHCGAMNPADSTFCGECGWQIMPRDAEVEIEKYIAAIQKKAGPDTVKARPEAEPVGGEAKLDPEQAAISTEMETGQVDPKTVLEEGPAGSGTDLDPEPVAITAEPEAGQDDLKTIPEEGPAGGEADLDLQPVVDSVGPEARPASANAGENARLRTTSEAIPTLEKVLYQDGERVTITRSAAILGDRVYGWADIFSVTMETSRASRLPSLLLAALGAIILVLAVASLGRDPGLGLVLIAGGLALLAIGAILAITAHDQYMVCVSMASGVEVALVSTDRDHIQKTVNAMRLGLEQAGSTSATQVPKLRLLAQTATKAPDAEQGRISKYG